MPNITRKPKIKTSSNNSSTTFIKPILFATRNSKGDFCGFYHAGNEIKVGKGRYKIIPKYK